jgi:hypothetical protein
LEHGLKLLWQGVDRIGDQHFELLRFTLIRHQANGRVSSSENPPRGR